jgi:hypothetical protein
MPIPEARRRDPHQGGEIQMEFCLSQTDLRLPLVFQRKEDGEILMSGAAECDHGCRGSEGRADDHQSYWVVASDSATLAGFAAQGHRQRPSRSHFPRALVR